MTDAIPQRTLRPRHKIARRTHLVLAAAFLGAVVLQVFFAGAGVLSDTQYIQRHVLFVEWLQPIPVFLVASAFMGRMSRMSKLAPVGAWLGIVLQYEFVKLSSAAAGLHVVNGFLIAWLATEMLRKAWRQRPGAADEAG